MTGLTVSELRGAVRSLSRSPTLTACAVLCLALGIGATTALWSAFSRAMLEPLPFRAPERLVSVHRITPQSGPMGGWSQSPANYNDLSRATSSLADLAAITWGSAVVNLPGEAVQASQLRVTGNTFTTLGASASLGRLVRPEDDRLDAPMVAVLSDAFWRARFGGDPALVGRTVAINGSPVTIVGVLPPRFRIPLGTNMLSADVWVPIRFTPEQGALRRNNFLQTFGRLSDGATVESAERELRSIFANLIRENPSLRGDNVRVAPLHAESLRTVRSPLLLLFGAVCMVLLIAAINVAALLLARGVQRQRELAVRAAVGASGWDLVRPVLAESLILAAVSVALGVSLALAGVKTIGNLAAARIPHLEGLGVDAGVLGFALVLTVVVALVAAIAPALRGRRVDPQDALRGGRSGAGREQHRALRALVVFEMALSLVLLIGAGLVFKGFARLVASDPGFDASGVATFTLVTAAARYPDQTAARNFLEPVLASIDAVPGVEAVAAISAVPYVTWGNNSGIRYRGRAGTDETQYPIVEQRLVSSDFFAVTGQRLLSGRLLQLADDTRPGAPRVVVVNEALARRDFQGADPVGQQFHTSDTTFATIVGVVSDIRNAGPFREAAPEMYSLYHQLSPGTTSFGMMLRVTSGDPLAVVSGVRSAVRAVDSDAAVANVARMTDVISQSLGGPRFYLSLLATFAAVALVLATAGLYGVMNYVVVQRTREIGIRTALGSPRLAIMRLVTSEGVWLVATGAVIGVVGGIAVTRAMVSLLYGVNPLDPGIWLIAVIVMFLAGIAAVSIPARRAARVDPLVAIQTE